MRTSVLNGLGQALRWLRDRQGKKQYQVAEAAGITKGMLSAYETGRQKPSLETLEKLLDTLGCDLHDLHNAIQIVNGRPQTLRSRDAPEGPGEGGGESIERTLGLSEPLPMEQERIVRQLLDGFHKLIRYVARAAAKPPRPDGQSEDEGPS